MRSQDVFVPGTRGPVPQCVGVLNQCCVAYIAGHARGTVLHDTNTTRRHDASSAGHDTTRHDASCRRREARCQTALRCHWSAALTDLSILWRAAHSRCALIALRVKFAGCIMCTRCRLRRRRRAGAVHAGWRLLRMSMVAMASDVFAALGVLALICAQRAGGVVVNI